jgi:phage-related protein
LVYFAVIWLSLPGGDEKPLHWLASAKKDYQAFPEEVQSEMGYALGLAQLGARHPHAKAWKGEGPGIFEVVEDYRGDTYRGVYTVRFAGVVYVLHAFQKKSKCGIRTPQEDVKLISERLKRAQQDYESREHHDHPRQ